MQVPFVLLTYSLGVETGYPDPKGKVFFGVEISNIHHAVLSCGKGP